MMTISKPALWLASLGLLAACSGPSTQEKQEAAANTPAQTVETPVADSMHLPAPYATKSVTNRVNIVPWPAGKIPTAPPGFAVTEYAGNFDSPRWLYVLPNGDVLVTEASTIPMTMTKKVAAELKLDKSRSLRDHSANRITLLRDSNHDGRPDLRTTFLTKGLSQPFGMLVLGNYFYVANTDGVLRFPYQPGATAITGDGQRILGLPKGGYNNH